MQTSRATSRLSPVIYKAIKPTTLPLNQTRNMSFFPRYSSPIAEFAPLFRAFDDALDVHRSSNVRSVRAFAPKFDVREVENGYQLDGELPGIDQKDVQIEFTDPHTLVIKGRTERSYESGDREAIDGQGRITEGDHHESHQPSVEDAGEDGETSTAVATQSNKGEVSKESAQNKPKFWVSERSVGEFHRTFSFPTRVDQDAVKASLKNGILSILVPKAPAPTSKRINIE